MAKGQKKELKEGELDKSHPDYKEHMKSWESKKDKKAGKANLNKVPGKYLKFNEILKGEN